MNSPNPFDFSDFGPGKQAPPGGAPPSAPGQSAGQSSGFDPWANQKPAPARPGTPDAFGSPTFDAAGGRDAFGQLTANPASLGALSTAGPPLVWFAVALALAVVGVGLAGTSALSGPMIAAAAAGWLLAGPLAIGALAVFSRVDTRRRTEAIYSAPTWTSTLYWIVLAVCLLGIAVGAWQIALWAGTL
jgi:hypothetical protein